MANEQNLTPFPKGNNANPNGRPRKYVSLLREQGYKLSEINDTIQSMLSMEVTELKSVFEDERATILEKIIASAMNKSLRKGDLISIETLISRVYGKPKESVEAKINNEKLNELARTFEQSVVSTTTGSYVPPSDPEILESKETI